MKYLLFILAVALVGAIGFIFYLATNPPYYPNYKEVYRKGKFVLLTKVDKGKDDITKGGPGSRISREDGIRMIQKYQRFLDLESNDTSLRYVNFRFDSLFSYVAYMSEMSRGNTDELGVRIFMAKSDEKLIRNGREVTYPDGSNVYKYTLVLAPLENHHLSAKRIEWNFFNQGSICPVCPTAPTGLEDVK